MISMQTIHLKQTLTGRNTINLISQPLRSLSVKRKEEKDRQDKLSTQTQCRMFWGGNGLFWNTLFKRLLFTPRFFVGAVYQCAFGKTIGSKHITPCSVQSSKMSCDVIIYKRPACVSRRGGGRTKDTSHHPLLISLRGFCWSQGRAALLRTSVRRHKGFSTVQVLEPELAPCGGSRLL